MLKRLFRGWWVNIAWGGVERRGVDQKIRGRPAGELASRHCKRGLARSSPQGPMEGGCAIQTTDRRQGGTSITRWRFATGEVGGEPLKNRGGRKAALKEGGGIRGLRLGPPFRRGPTEVGPKGGKEGKVVERARHDRGEGWGGGGGRGDFNQTVCPAGRLPEKGGGVRGLRLGPPFRRGPTEVGLKRGAGVERTQHAREEGWGGGGGRGDFNQTVCPAGRLPERGGGVHNCHGCPTSMALLTRCEGRVRLRERII